MVSGFLSLPWSVWGVLALLVSAVFVFVVPDADKVHAAVGLQFIIVRWFHSLCWVLLAANFFLRASGRPELAGLANLLGMGGGLAYAAYLLTLATLPAA